LLTFTDMTSALAGIEQINSDYPRHCLAARKLAEQVFSSDQVLPRLLDAAMG
jgi:hypothetical protein